MSTRKSARLQENIDEKDKNIFIVDNEDAPSLNGQIIEENDHWITVWSKLKKQDGDGSKEMRFQVTFIPSRTSIQSKTREKISTIL